MKAPGEFGGCTVCFEKTSVIDRRSHSTETIFENPPRTVGANFPSASTQRAGCWTQGMLSNRGLLGEIEILCRERKRGVFQEPGSHPPLLPACHIFNKGTGCQHTPSPFLYVRLEVCLTQQAKAEILQSFKQPA